SRPSAMPADCSCTSPSPSPSSGSEAGGHPPGPAPGSAEAAGQLGPQLLVEAAPAEQPGHVPHRVVDLASPDLDRGLRIRTGQRPEHRPVVADDAITGR